MLELWWADVAWNNLVLLTSVIKLIVEAAFQK